MKGENIRKDSEYKGIKDSLNSLLKKREAYVRVKGTLTVLKWKEIVGDVLAQYTVPTYFKDGILYIGVVSSLFKGELELMKGEILEKIKKSVENSPVTDLKFRLLNTRIPKSNAAKGESPQLIQLGKEDLRWVQCMVERLKVEENLKKKYFKLLESYKVNQKLREISGFKKCKKCGALFKGKGLLCPVCEKGDIIRKNSE